MSEPAQIEGSGDAAARPMKAGHAVSATAARRAVWIGYATLAVVFIALVAAPVPARAGQAVAEVLFTGVCGLTLAGTLSMMRAAKGTERRFWRLLSISAAFILSSQAYYTFYILAIDRRGPAFPSISTALDVAAMLVFPALITTLARFRSHSMAARVRYALDTAAVAIVAAVLVFRFLVSPWFDSLGTASGYAKAVCSAYPVIGVLLLIGTFRNLLGPRVARWRIWERLTGLGLSGLAAGLILYPLNYAEGHWAFARPWGTGAVEVAWLTGLYLIFAGAVYRRTERGEPWTLRPMPAIQISRGWMPSVVLPGIQMVALPLFGVAAWTSTGVEGRWLFSVAGAALAMSLTARTILTVSDNGALFSRAVSDPLTGLYNHRRFQEMLGAGLESAERYGEPISLLILDLDDFSRINSTGGHAAGDRALERVAERVEAAVRDRDVVCRIGGDEIGVVLPDADGAEAMAVATRVLSEIRRVSAPDGRPLTASGGIASFPRHARERDELVRRADGAQYWAKYHGKDQVVLYDPDVVVTLGAEERIRSLQSQAHLNTVRALAAAVDARDPATEHHGRKVAALAVMLAAEAGLDDDKGSLIELAGLLHDVGNIGLPDTILRKPGALTASERVRVEGHPELGERILASTRLGEVLPWVRHHHERWDGTGYPDGLAGEHIPLEARILSIVDAYDAMTSDRPYRSAMSREAALQEIDLNLGTQFDPMLGEIFIRLAAMRRLS